VLSELSDDGFVLETDDIQSWLVFESDEEDFVPDESPRRAWAGWLRALLPGASTPAPDG
jgi:hypothetical protein